MASPSSFVSSLDEGCHSTYSTAPNGDGPQASTQGSGTFIPSEGFRNELESIKQWFAALNGVERDTAFDCIAEGLTRRETQRVIRLLQLHEHKKWSQELKKKLKRHENYGKPPLPAFPHDCTDPTWLRGWLRALRLHKYEKCLSGLRPPDLLKLRDEDLEKLGVDTIGARNKFIHVFTVARAEAENEAFLSRNRR